LRGVPTLADFEPDVFQNPDMVSARSRIRVIESADHSARYPAHFGARISCNGDTVDLVDTLGDPERPLPADGLAQKARDLMAWGNIQNAEALISWIETAREDSPVSELLELLP
jgi:2-methylcitrate dehydratase PrpD